MKLKTSYTPPGHDPGLRGAVSTFTRASRRRMMEFMARLKIEKVRATFLTLTFSGTPSAAEAKAALKRFTMRMRRKYGRASGVWRMEFQVRGTPHFHLLLFGLPFIPQDKLQLVWEACTGEEKSILDIRLVGSRKKMTNYISKYIAKMPDDEHSTSLEDDAYQHASEKDPPGRFWGYINKNALPFGDAHEGTLIDRDVFLYLHWTIRKLSRGRGAPSLSRATLFSEDAHEIFAHAMRLGGLYASEMRKVYHMRRYVKVPIHLLQCAFFAPSEYPNLTQMLRPFVRFAPAPTKWV